MTTLISSVRDLETWAANMFPDLDSDQTGRIARAIWDREDFPHPVNNDRHRAARDDARGVQVEVASRGAHRAVGDGCAAALREHSEPGGRARRVRAAVTGDAVRGDAPARVGIGGGAETRGAHSELGQQRLRRDRAVSGSAGCEPS